MNPEQKKIISSFYLPFLFAAVLWVVKIVEVYFHLDFSVYGVVPREVDRLPGIVTMPFIHSDFKHLFSNSVPLVILGATLIYFYRESALKVFLLIYLLHGIWLWLGGRTAYHIGASGLVYGLASFLFFSGVFRRYMRLMAISMLVVFLYGGMVWGIFPLFHGMSWEAHLAGSAAGILCAWFYRKEGPQRPQYDWEKEEEDEDLPAEELQNDALQEPDQNNAKDNSITINYHYKPEEGPLKEKGDDKN